MTLTEDPPVQATSNGHTVGETDGQRSKGTGGLESIDKARTNGAASRVPPHNLDAEAALLGAMFLSRDAIAAAIDTCTADDFYKPANAHVYQTIIDLYARGEPSDPVTISDELTRRGLLDSAGGVARLVSLQAETPASTRAPHYAALVRETSTLRRLIAAAGEIAEMGYSRGDSVQLLDQAEQLLFDIGDRSRVGGHAQPIDEVFSPWLDLLERRYNGEGPQAISTGLVDLDEKLGGGLRPGQMWTVAGRPGSGKSIIGVQFGCHIAMEHRTPALVVSAEMPTEEVVERVVASQARIDNQALRTGHLSTANWQSLSATVARLSGVPLYIYDAPGATLASIRSEVRRVSVAGGAHPTVIVDYLQLLTTANKAENRQVEVDNLARGLKLLARDLNIPVISLCQLNRNLENRADKRPVLGDLRESGGIENHSDGVIGVYRDEMYHTDSKDAGTAELIVLKQRGGPTGTVRVAYRAHFGTFVSMAKI